MLRALGDELFVLANETPHRGHVELGSGPSSMTKLRLELLQTERKPVRWNLPNDVTVHLEQPSVRVEREPFVAVAGSRSSCSAGALEESSRASLRNSIPLQSAK